MRGRFGLNLCGNAPFGRGATCGPDRAAATGFAEAARPDTTRGEAVCTVAFIICPAALLRIPVTVAATKNAEKENRFILVLPALNIIKPSQLQTLTGTMSKLFSE